tara:strand:- start:435 stop:1052 length:618 start_codon:yes stop_codon:yes gene_type:complete
VQELLRLDTRFAQLELVLNKLFWVDEDTFPGFCLSWSILRFVSCLNRTHFVEQLETAFLRNKGLEALQATAQKVLFKPFCDELPQRHGLGIEDCRQLFNDMLPCIFIRLFATYLVICVSGGQRGIAFGNNMEEFLNILKLTVSRANLGNVIFYTKHIWHHSTSLDIVIAEGSATPFFFTMSHGAVKEYVLSVDTTRPFEETLVAA